MYAVLLTIEVIVCIAMIGVILLQRSEGGGLGLGSGGGVGGLMSGRGAANVLTRTTVILATIFICTSIALALLAKSSRQSNPLGEAVPTSTPLGTLPDLAPSAPATPTPSATPTPDAPADAAPAAPAPASATGDTPAAATDTPAAPVATEPSAPANPQPAAPAPAAPASGGTN
jgi:preprotein translocase subunit SecG